MTSGKRYDDEYFESYMKGTGLKMRLKEVWHKYIRDLSDSNDKNFRLFGLYSEERRRFANMDFVGIGNWHSRALYHAKILVNKFAETEYMKKEYKSFIKFWVTSIDKTLEKRSEFDREQIYILRNVNEDLMREIRIWFESMKLGFSMVDENKIIVIYDRNLNLHLFNHVREALHYNGFLDKVVSAKDYFRSLSKTEHINCEEEEDE